MAQLPLVRRMTTLSVIRGGVIGVAAVVAPSIALGITTVYIIGGLKPFLCLLGVTLVLVGGLAWTCVRHPRVSRPHRRSWLLDFRRVALRLGGVLASQLVQFESPLCRTDRGSYRNRFLASHTGGYVVFFNDGRGLSLLSFLRLHCSRARSEGIAILYRRRLRSLPQWAYLCCS